MGPDDATAGPRPGCGGVRGAAPQALGALGERIELVRGERLENLVVHQRYEGAGPVGERQRALEPPRGRRPLQVGSAPAEVGVPEDQDHDVERDRQRRRERHRNVGDEYVVFLHDFRSQIPFAGQLDDFDLSDHCAPR